jgi:hypothetical protein
VNDQFVNSAVYVLLAALGGSAITAVASLEAGRRTARHADRAELAARRLEAYVNLLVAAGDVLETYRRNLDALSPDLSQQDAEKGNAHMADLAAALHRASAVVALTGSDLARRQGNCLYEIASGVAAMRIVPTGDSNYPFVMDDKAAEDKRMEAAIDNYKTALIPETTALPKAHPRVHWSLTAVARRASPDRQA